MNFYIHSPHVKRYRTLCKWPLHLTMHKKKYTAEQFLLCFIRLTWSLPPHSPAGRFAHKPCSPLLLLSTLSAGLTSKPHHAHNFFIAYVDRFACDWPRLSTTDPLCTLIISIKRTFVTHCPS